MVKRMGKVHKQFKIALLKVNGKMEKKWNIYEEIVFEWVNSRG